MTGNDDKSPQSITEHYWTVLPKYIAAVNRAITLSQKTGGYTPDSPRQHWALVLFTRLCSAAISVNDLCPGSPANTAGTHWDFSSLAPLVRSLVRTGLMLFYLGTEVVGEDESRARVLIMELRDCMERLHMFQNYGASNEKIRSFEVRADKVRTELSSNSYFARLPAQMRESLLKGDRASILTED